jgi:hypothetical protein
VAEKGFLKGRVPVRPGYLYALTIAGFYRRRAELEATGVRARVHPAYGGLACEPSDYF